MSNIHSIELAALQAVRQFVLDRVSLILNGPTTFRLLPLPKDRQNIIDNNHSDQEEKGQWLEKVTQTNLLNKKKVSEIVSQGINSEKYAQENPEAVF